MNFIIQLFVLLFFEKMVDSREWIPLIIIIIRVYRNSLPPYESYKVNSVTENKSEELQKGSSRALSTTSNSLTVPSMQQSRMKSHRIGQRSSKRKPI